MPSRWISKRKSRDGDSEDESEGDRSFMILFFIPDEDVHQQVLALYVKAFLDKKGEIWPGNHPQIQGMNCYFVRARNGISSYMVTDIRNDTRAWNEESLLLQSFNQNRDYGLSTTWQQRLKQGPSRSLPLTAGKLPSISEQPLTDSGYGSKETSTSGSYKSPAFRSNKANVRYEYDHPFKRGQVQVCSFNNFKRNIAPSGPVGPTTSSEDPNFRKTSCAPFYRHKWDDALKLFVPDPELESVHPALRYSCLTFRRSACLFCLGHIGELQYPPTTPGHQRILTWLDLQLCIKRMAKKADNSDIVRAMIQDFVCWIDHTGRSRALMPFLELVREVTVEVLGKDHPFSHAIYSLNSSKEAPYSLKRDDNTGEPANSEGEESFMGSMDSDEAAHLWETELDPNLRSLRSRLIEQIVSSYVKDTENLDTFHFAKCEDAKCSNEEEGTSTNPASCMPPSKSSSRSVNKRIRHNDGEDENYEDENRRSNRKKPRHTATSISVDGRLLACPYCKFDPTRYSERNIDEKNYRGCSSIYLTSISRVKQHLYRVHKRADFYCVCCFQIFNTEVALSSHSRQRPACEVKAACFTEKMTSEQVSLIRRRTPGKSPAETWFEIFKILFPNAPIPDSPYVETVSSDAIQQFTDHFYRQARSRLSALVTAELEGRLLLERDQQRILDSALESAIGQLVWLTGPHSGRSDDNKDIAASPEVDVGYDAQDSPHHDSASSSEDIPTPPPDNAETIHIASNVSINGVTALQVSSDGGDSYEEISLPRSSNSYSSFIDAVAQIAELEQWANPIEDGTFEAWMKREMGSIS